MTFVALSQIVFESRSVIEKNKLNRIINTIYFFHSEFYALKLTIASIFESTRSSKAVYITVMVTPTATQHAMNPFTRIHRTAFKYTGCQILVIRNPGC